MQLAATQPALPPACPLAALPEGVLEDILVRSGLHSRQLCRAFRTIHPPLRSLVPHGIDKPEDLIAALASLPSSLTSLDLRQASRTANTPAPLDALNTPNLQRLTLPPSSRMLSSILSALHHHNLPHLHTLHAPTACTTVSWYHNEPAEVAWPDLLQVAIATRLRALTLPISSLATLHAAAPSTFPQLTAIRFKDGDDWEGNVDAGQLASLLGPAPALRLLSVDAYGDHVALTACDRLTALATLTALVLVMGPTPMTHLLPPVGTLTSLRCLRLDLHHNSFYYRGQEGRWLQRLTLLTQLDVTLTHGIADDDGADDLAAPALLLDEPAPVHIRRMLVQAAAALPQLQDLRLAFGEWDPSGDWLDWLACGTADSFYRHLAAATQLRRLRLCNVPLPPAEVCLLSNLQGLTSLRFQMCTAANTDAAVAAAAAAAAAAAVVAAFQQEGEAGAVLGGPPGSGAHCMAALPGLRELFADDCNAPHLLQGVAALPRLHTLVFNEYRRRPIGTGRLLEVLGGLRGVLVRLELVVPAGAAVLRSLGHMAHLRVLSLCAAPAASARGRQAHPPAPCWHHDLVLPSSLVRCYVPVTLPGAAGMKADDLHVLRARYPWVSFKPHRRLVDDEW